ncbi:hypothetical protein ING2E5B_0465 [Fermentimonas caenicola]|jgi:hypothetical protein|uniref:Uncharacterized protein n=1 Tax=Fermentimonas caenicola TaxID=1562970 RepID=A0A098BZY6_9BACT|nr:hypothetical protein [Bacteroidales bacterium]CEA15232.1 hypothetical protein ING2E5B_0465 [Fermentimonas caenicola]
MDGTQLRDLIGQKRPRYKEQYKALIDRISKKGDASGKGDFSSFGAYYQTYMYAFIIGYKLGKQNFILPNEDSNYFFVFSQWSPIAIRDYIVMLLLNKSEDFGFKWIELEDASIEVIESFVAELIRQMEGYANAGFEYLQEKWENENMIFRNPFVFVKILEELENNN